MKSNMVLVRLKEIDNELSSFYTEKPSEFLNMYYFCKENDIPLQDKDSEIIGDIEDIDVFFGGGDYLPCIDVWINRW